MCDRSVEFVSAEEMDLLPATAHPQGPDKISFSVFSLVLMKNSEDLEKARNLTKISILIFSAVLLSFKHSLEDVILILQMILRAVCVCDFKQWHNAKYIQLSVRQQHTYTMGGKVAAVLNNHWLTGIMFLYHCFRVAIKQWHQLQPHYDSKRVLETQLHNDKQQIILIFKELTWK